MNESNDKKRKNFDLNSLTSREFQAFLILLTFEGSELPLLKTKIDLRFGHKSRTKGYDYINGLCQKGLVKKKNYIEKGKKHVTIHVNKKIRSEYEKLIVPTLSNIKKIVRELIQDDLNIIKVMEKKREKFKNYTETIINAVIELINTSSVNTIKNKRFPKKLEDIIRNYYRAEILKSDMFSV